MKKHGIFLPHGWQLNFPEEWTKISSRKQTDIGDVIIKWLQVHYGQSGMTPMTVLSTWHSLESFGKGLSMRGCVDQGGLWMHGSLYCINWSEKT